MVRIRVEIRQRHGSDAVLMQEVHGDHGHVGGGIVLQECEAMVTRK